MKQFLKKINPPPILQPEPPLSYQNMDDGPPPPYDVVDEPPSSYDDNETFFIDDDLDSHVFAKDKTDGNSQPVMKLEPRQNEANDYVMVISYDDEVQITKSLNYTNVTIKSKPTMDAYIKISAKKKWTIGQS